MSQKDASVSICDILIDNRRAMRYTGLTMMIQNIYLASEATAPAEWCYRDLYSYFSRLYYVIEGDAYYKEEGKTVKLKKNHLYLTPVEREFDIYHDPQSPLLHTYAHVVTVPAVHALVEIEVTDGTPLADAVALWRRHIGEPNKELQISTAQLVVSLIEAATRERKALTPAEQIKEYLNGLGTNPFHMQDLALALGYTREHLTRLFFSAFGCTPRQYFNARRMDLAVKKLQGGASIKAVALDLGFSSDHAFSKAFRSHFGLPPQKFLSSLKEDVPT